MKKIIMVMFIFAELQLCAIATTMNHRLLTSSPLLYKQIDYSYENLSIEFEPFISQMFDAQHINENLIVGGKSALNLNQLGGADMNPAWLYLGSSNSVFDYRSNLTFVPFQQLYGLLFHTYQQFEHLFIDMRTSLLQSKSMVALQEFSGNGGGINTDNGNLIYNAFDAFSQPGMLYGKAGIENHVTGFDNIQILLGASTRFDLTDSEKTKSYFAGFALVEVPTGSGTKSEWMFEPQVGTNHWGIGFGFDGMFLGDYGWSFVFGGNFRHLIANWETRSFDLTENGPWSRYLLITPLSVLLLAGGDGNMDLGTPGINIFTQDALIGARNQITMYGRLQKRMDKCYLELSYNLFYNQAERIKQITAIPSGYGIYVVGTNGGISTASNVTISENLPSLDNTPVEIVTSDLNLSSGAAGQWLSNTVGFRLQREQKNYTYGIGGTIDLARTAQAISSWTLWANFEILLS